MNFKNLNFALIRRIVLYAAVALVGFLLWNAWDKEHPSNPAPASTNTSSSTQQSFVPPSYTTSPAQSAGNVNTAPPPSNVPLPAANPSGLINVKTDVLDVNISATGGDLVDAKLLKYYETLNKPLLPMPILESDPNSLYLAQTGLKTNNAAQTETIQYHTDKIQYRLAEGQKTLAVSLTGATASGVQVTKTYLFERGKYNIGVEYQLNNKGSNTWLGNIYQQMVRKNVPPKGSQHSRSYDGAAISTPDKPYQKLAFKKLNSEQVNQNVQGGWIAMQQPYFLSAWIPPSNQSSHFYSSVTDNTYTLGYVGPQLQIAPNATVSQKSMFYVGPELPDELKKLAKGLDLTIDYGWLWMFSKVIFWVMDHVHTLVKNWGWSIIITTLLIKLLFYKLSEKSYTSMAKMREIQPRLQALKDRYGEDKQALSRATMEFYKKEKINPLGGCLPSIVQIPVFIALILRIDRKCAVTTSSFYFLDKRFICA